MQLWISQQGALKPMLRFMVKQRLGPTGGGKPAAEASLNWTKRASPSNYGKRGRGGGRLETWFGYGPFGCWTDEPVPAEESSGAAPERKLQNKPRSFFFFFGAPMTFMLYVWTQIWLNPPTTKSLLEGGSFSPGTALLQIHRRTCVFFFFFLNEQHLWCKNKNKNKVTALTEHVGATGQRRTPPRNAHRSLSLCAEEQLWTCWWFGKFGGNSESQLNKIQWGGGGGFFF